MRIIVLANASAQDSGTEAIGGITRGSILGSRKVATDRLLPNLIGYELSVWLHEQELARLANEQAQGNGEPVIEQLGLWD